MEKQVLSDFRLGEWQQDYYDMRQPRASLGSLVDGYVDTAGLLRCRGAVAQRIVAALLNDGVYAFEGAMLAGRRAMVYGINVGSSNGRAEVFDPAVAVMSTSRVTTEVGNHTVVGNMVVMGTRLDSAGPLGGLTRVWGGSLKNDQSFTNVARTTGSKVVTRAAGGFTTGSLLDVGMLLPNWPVAGGMLATGGKGAAVIVSIDSDTQVTVDRPSPFTETVSANIVGPPIALDMGGGFGGLVTSIAGRLILMARNKMLFSNGPDPTTGGPRTEIWPAGNLHEFPIDAQGVALAVLRDRVFAFTEAGNYAVSGMAYEITDGSGTPLHAIEQIASKSVALAQKGIVAWQGALIVPCRDGIYVMDGYAQPVLLSRSIPWAEMVRGGLEIGQATVYKERYLLPYRYGGQTYTLALRTDGVDTDVGTIFPAATFAMPANAFCYATAGVQGDSLISAGAKASGVLEAGQIFTAETAGVDFDATPAGGSMTMTSAPLALGDKALVRRVRVRYQYRIGTATTAPLLNISVAAEDNARTVTKSVAIDTGGVQWAAVDFDVPLESAVVTVSLSLSDAKPRDFVVHGIEVLYRAFGGS